MRSGRWKSWCARRPRRRPYWRSSSRGPARRPGRRPRAGPPPRPPGRRPDRAAHQGRGVAAQIALARRESHHRGQRHLGLATIVPTELPHTWSAWRGGRITEWKATLITRETACLSREDRAAVDAAVAGDAERL